MKKVKVTKLEPVFADARGKIFDILDNESILHVGLITAKMGAVRGNHFHKVARQYNYVLKGKLELKIGNVNGRKNEEKKYVLKKGSFVFIPNKIVHTLTALEDSEFIDLNTESRSGNGYELDTIRVGHDTGI